MSLLCKIGLHDWEYTSDEFGWIRICRRCGKKQEAYATPLGLRYRDPTVKTREKRVDLNADEWNVPVRPKEHEVPFKIFKFQREAVAKSVEMGTRYIVVEGCPECGADLEVVQGVCVSCTKFGKTCNYRLMSG